MLAVYAKVVLHNSAERQWRFRLLSGYPKYLHIYGSNKVQNHCRKEIEKQLELYAKKKGHQYMCRMQVIVPNDTCR
jgi:hypothetical protein